MSVKMVSSAAERQRRLRARRKRDKLCLLIEVDDVRLAAMLSDEITEGVFLDTDSPSREQLANAVGSFLEAYVTRYEQDKSGPL